MGWGDFLASAGGLAVLAIGLAEIGAWIGRGVDELFYRAWPPAAEDGRDVAPILPESDEVDRLRKGGGL